MPAVLGRALVARDLRSVLSILRPPHSSPPPRSLWRGTLLLALALLAACGSPSGDSSERPADAPERTSFVAQPSIGQCTRNEPLLRGPAINCTVDSQCSCGSHCDAISRTCKFQCMVPPANQAESCATGTQCDDTGRCVSPNPPPPGNGAVLSAEPPGVTTVAGGVAKTVQVRLDVYDPAAVAAATSTVVRAIARAGAQVSCNGSTFVAECTLATWTFSFVGTHHTATRALSIRTVAGTQPGRGDVQLRIDALDRDLTVPAGAAGSTSTDGEYVGSAARTGTPDGFPITATAFGNLLVLRDATFTLAPEGTLILDLIQGAVQPQLRNVTWLQAPGGSGVGTARYYSAPFTFDATTGALTVPFSIYANIGGGFSPGSQWTLNLRRLSAPVSQCTAAAPQCPSGQACLIAARVCVPTSVSSPPSSAYTFEDQRTNTWWSAMSSALGTATTPPAVPAFATAHADLLESLWCSTSVQAAHLGTAPSKDLSGVSHSGDLACVANGTANNDDNGAPIQSPGPIGLGTHLDRAGSAVSSALLETCLTELGRPVTNVFATNFAPTTGACVNLARALPSLRLLGADELGRGTWAYNGRESRLPSLLQRLTQQWAELHGFLASTGLSDADHRSAASGSPADGRQRLAALLDVLDAGWAALLDRRVIATVQSLLPRLPGDDASAYDPALDYRFAKQPSLYWTFNGATPRLDMMRGQAFVSSDPQCQSGVEGNEFGQGLSCPGLSATLPPATQSLIAPGGDMTVTFALGSNGGDMWPELDPGVWLAMPQLLLRAEKETENRTNDTILHVYHPTEDGPLEHVVFDGIGKLGMWTNASGGDSGFRGTAVALVRDGMARTYTLYLWKNCSMNEPLIPGCSGSSSSQSVMTTLTRSYQTEPIGRLEDVPGNTLFLGGPPPQCTSTYTPGCGDGAVAATFDDFAILPYALSPREFLRFAAGRNDFKGRRALWPADLSLVAHPTQTIQTSPGRGIVDAQRAYLEVLASFVDQLEPVAQAACESESPAARTELEAQLVRVGRSLRQSAVLSELTASDRSSGAVKSLQLARNQQLQISRAVAALRTCKNAYAMGEHEVPLYFNSISPNLNEAAAFFAASDHLLGLAEARVVNAHNALEAVRLRWDQARQSQLQQLQSDTARDIRVDELRTRYGEAMRGLCGIGDLTSHQVASLLEAGTLSPQTCYVKDTPACQTANATRTIAAVDPTCYRGAIGGALMDLRSADFASQAAHHAWQAAVGNSKAAKHLCVLQEMDLFGCAALDRQALTGVTCPEGHQGTLELVAAFNETLDDLEEDRAMFASIATYTAAFAGAVAATVATGGIAAPALILAGAVVTDVVTGFDGSISRRKRNFDLLLQKRSAQQEIRECWNHADQLERVIAASEDSAKEALSRMQAASLAFDNHLASARALALEAPLALEHERNRLSIPIAFHYWLPDAIEDYRGLMTSARRYTYMALRATEYDALSLFKTPLLGKPDRGGVLAATRPAQLADQLSKMRDQTNPRTTAYGTPALKFMAFDLGAKLFGLAEGDVDFGQALAERLRPVYSQRGEYLGTGLRFSLVPRQAVEDPEWRCAERIWRVNAGAAALPTTGDGVAVKLRKRNVFASRRCGSNGFQVASLRPATNLLVGGGEPHPYVPEATFSTADITMQSFDDPTTFSQFRNLASYLNGSSSELSMQGLWGDYILLFPPATFTSTFTPQTLRDFWLRFDYVSVDGTPQLLSPAPPAELELSTDPSPIVLEQE